jgi:thymidylate kinase
MFTVTLIGPDGVGKTTVSHELKMLLTIPAITIYMGDNVETSNVMLPTMRWWKSRYKNEIKDHSNGRKSRGSGLKKLLYTMRKGLGLLNRVMDEWYRQTVAWLYTKRGYVVIFDRHFVYDYYDVDQAKGAHVAPFKKRLHAKILKATLPEPDLVICMDAPGQVVFERKGEFTPEFLEKRRQHYLSLQDKIHNFVAIDATQNVESVVTQIKTLIETTYWERRR